VGASELVGEACKRVPQQADHRLEVRHGVHEGGQVAPAYVAQPRGYVTLQEVIFNGLGVSR
jgi:hypothetical protein